MDLSASNQPDLEAISLEGCAIAPKLIAPPPTHLSPEESAAIPMSLKVTVTRDQVVSTGHNTS